MTPLAASTSAIDPGLLGWAGLLAFLAAMIVVDLRIGSAREGLTVRRAAAWSAVWVGLAVGFGVVLLVAAPGAAGEAYFAGYVMEKALSLDNVFVFTLIFAALAVPVRHQPRLLLWGILIALVLRGAFIFAGAEALERFSWVAWPFAALLAWTGYRILRHREGDDEGARIVERVRRLVPMTEDASRPGMIVREGGRRVATPALAALIAIALADVLFAVDSVPAILAITTDTFVVFAANAFALLGLRALFFLVSGLVVRFAYLKLGLGVLLLGIAGKLAYAEVTGDKVPTAVTLGTIGAVLAVSIGASLIAERRRGDRPGAPVAEAS
ncbi:MAG TPA: TerC/Alx family metal homeostasis membrane protein [Solirubrobacteraceae bacterium]|nr:TerC/Alx family metal homeostasis membrane protein [Solirubrobacteraceae bacterium]